MKRILRAVYIYCRLITQHVKAVLEYQADFLIAVFAAVITQVIGFIFLWVIFNHIPAINGWKFWEVAFIYAAIFFTEGFVSLFLNGIWSINWLVNKGRMDILLVRPVSPLIQVIGMEAGMNGLGNLLIGGFIIYQSLINMKTSWSFLNVLMIVLIFISGFVIRFSIYLAANCIGFWVKSPGNAFSNMVHNMSEFGKYPITIYPLGIQLIVSIFIPYAFISFFPAAYIFEKPDWALPGMLSPVVAVCCLLTARIIFYKGVGRYESTGS